MAWTYGGDPSASPRDRVRFHIGDTDIQDPQLLDSEIDALLSDAGTPLGAAVLACEALAAKYSRQVSKSMSQVSIQAGQRAQNYLALAARLNKKAVLQKAVPVVGGIRYSERRENARDTDLIKSVAAHDDEMHADEVSFNAPGLRIWRG